MIHSVKMVSVDSSQSGVEKGMTGSSLEVESIKEVGIEVDMCDKVTIAEPGVGFESEKDKEDGERELDGAFTLESGVKNSIPKFRMLLKQEVIMVGLGRLV